MRDQPSDGGGGFLHGKTFDTVEQAAAASAKRLELEEWLNSLPAAERAEWFALNGDENGSVNIEELE